MEKEAFISEVSKIEKYSSQFSSFEGDYMFSRISNSEPFEKLREGPVRVSGMTIILTLAGSMEIDVNLSTYELSVNTVLVAAADCLLHVRSADWEKFDAYVFVISPDFIRDINFDINLIKSTQFTPSQSPTLTLSDEEMKLMRRYFDLIHYNTINNTDEIYVRSISRNLIAASVYQLMQFAIRQKEHQPASERQRSRRSNYVKDFMCLIHEHHRRERSISFYADKLFISPKYLSLLIKEATGRTAAQWIDEFVILEAKNMLRFSGKNIQQIAYELNFNNQSSFGKYFKHITGMSPTAYQRS